MQIKSLGYLLFCAIITTSAQIMPHPLPTHCPFQTVYFNFQHCASSEKLHAMIISDDGRTKLKANIVSPYQICIPKEIFSGNAYLIRPGMDGNGKGVAKIGFSFTEKKGKAAYRAAYLSREGDTIGHASTGRLLAIAAAFESASFGGWPYGENVLKFNSKANEIITSTDKKAWLDLNWCPQPV